MLRMQQFIKFHPLAQLSLISNISLLLPQPIILEVVPPLLLFLAKHPVVSKFDVSSIKYCVSGAAPLTKDLIDELTSRHPDIISCRQGL